MLKSEMVNCPGGIGKLILSGNGIVVFGLLGTEKFISFCKKRDIVIDKKRLLRLERLGVFFPLFRVNLPSSRTEQMVLPIDTENLWFKQGWALETTSRCGEYNVPSEEGDNFEAYYSIFQIYQLVGVLGLFDGSLQLDELVESGDKKYFSKSKEENLLETSRVALPMALTLGYRNSIALLCQYISDRYGPQVLSDKRTFMGGGGSHSYGDRWIVLQIFNWDWFGLVQDWNPNDVATLFCLTPDKLRAVFEDVAIFQANLDPLEDWYQLVQFVSVRERERLKGKALLSETMRIGANMLRLLYKDLYGEELPHSNEVNCQILRHVPELEVRKDILRYLELVLNQYNLNPKPKVVLILEGQSDALVVDEIFKQYYKFHQSVVGIEVVVLKGIDNATGKRKDSYCPILALVDYLHSHQTISYIVLDNENNATRLSEEAREKKTIFSSGRNITCPEYVKTWRRSLEFDNYSSSEIVDGLNAFADGKVVFTESDIREGMSGNISLEKIFEEKAQYGLNKNKFNLGIISALIKKLPASDLQERPIFKIIKDVIDLAKINRFPRTQGSWDKNQKSGYVGAISKPQ